MANFFKAYEATNDIEKFVLTDDPLDRGGQTFGGISRRAWPTWGGWEIIDAGVASIADSTLARLQLSHANFFRLNFWNPLRLDLIEDQTFANKLYDASVNTGIHQAVVWAQRAANVVGPARLKEDGIIGDASVAVFQTLMSNWHRRWLWFTVYETYQRQFYIDQATKDRNQMGYLAGWLSKRCTFREVYPV